MIHIYTAVLQPATHYVDRCSEVEFTGGFAPEKKIFCQCCDKKRLAKNCVVQCFYDGLRVWCADGHGCKNPHTIARKRRQQHKNRSLGQLRRRAKEKAKP